MNEEMLQGRPEDGVDPMVAAASRPRRLSPVEVGGTSVLPTGDRQRSVYIALAIFFGAVGIHNFYARRTLFGVIELGLSLTLFWTGIVPLCVWLVAIGECFGAERDGRGRRLW